VDRRVTAESWRQEERRLPPEAREKAISKAA
jgi:hypothetical protein